MTKRIFVTATNTDIGKTYTTKMLLREFASRGIKVGVIKPIESGVVNGYATDAEELLELIKELNPKLWHLEVEDIAPITYELAASPYVASNNTIFDIKTVLKKIDELEAFCDLIIIEGAGGLYVPIDDKYMMIDLIKMLNSVALLVTHCSLGCINDTLLSKGALEVKKIPHVVAFNCKGGDESFGEISEPYFLKTDFEVLKVNRDIEKICDVLYNLPTI
ncbi:MAG: dethiobiotin synthase [Sulfurimonas sp.]|uniref:dethiobiotin synthase n=1 Tax=Sulfurimonas sp. TaxID=2022749 RepID=UPI0026127557|nr:dethiobiotin synthase [Sulfurimonas sp.]MDD3477171.1 dethiobiotin synthase [Sulfurimonas sp.]